ncbi:putative RNA helicase [Cavenderia fasciculata]|uniref:RNA helicase n=1 Tax=Cavenderia fasciculata TaxID=261658 RepID=F4QED7_CACFS|nr:putative RNA helicase [Cavenderia fasciculata]EGG14084.1 putative RNA helicase [Cavenderia fasciculata]|eukprot:XP_004350792.1 putative RNA helicase [Cavenderia fasciculata]
MVHPNSNNKQQSQQQQDQNNKIKKRDFRKNRPPPTTNNDAKNKDNVVSFDDQGNQTTTKSNNYNNNNNSYNNNNRNNSYNNNRGDDYSSSYENKGGYNNNRNNNNSYNNRNNNYNNKGAATGDRFNQNKYSNQFKDNNRNNNRFSKDTRSGTSTTPSTSTSTEQQERYIPKKVYEQKTGIKVDTAVKSDKILDQINDEQVNKRVYGEDTEKVVELVPVDFTLDENKIVGGFSKFFLRGLVESEVAVTQDTEFVIEGTINDDKTFIGDSKIPIVGDGEHSVLAPEFNTYLTETNLYTPNYLQQHLWPLALTGHDLMVISPPGSGKTIGFLLPLVPHIQHRMSQKTLVAKSPVALIVLPTRELAQQVYRSAIPLKRHFGISAVPIYGGVDPKPQIELLKNTPHILIATPGRLLDFIQQDIISLKGVTVAVLDEADKILSMGFMPQLVQIRSQIRPNAHIILSSATFSAKLEQNWLSSPSIKLRIGKNELPDQSNIKQHLIYVKSSKMSQKFETRLKEIIKQGKKIIVFFNQTANLITISKLLKKSNINHSSLFGKKTQHERDLVIGYFKNNASAKLLLCTDVVGRGIHIDDLDVVFNYQLPTSLEQYCHRIGRVGRNGRQGCIAYSFVTVSNKTILPDLVQYLETNGNKVENDFKKNINLQLGLNLDIPISKNQIEREEIAKKIQTEKNERLERRKQREETESEQKMDIDKEKKEKKDEKKDEKMDDSSDSDSSSSSSSSSEEEEEDDSSDSSSSDDDSSSSDDDSSSSDDDSSSSEDESSSSSSSDDSSSESSSSDDDDDSSSD